MKSAADETATVGAGSVAMSMNSVVGSGTMATISRGDGSGVSWRWQLQRADACRIRLHIGHWPADPARQHVHTASVDFRVQQLVAVGTTTPTA